LVTLLGKVEIRIRDTFRPNAFLRLGPYDHRIFLGR
jgi:hypothetical protein